MRYWKGISAAKSDSGRRSKERMASRADEKADEFYELSKSARFEASRIEGLVIELKRQIFEKEKKD